jgi:hypothetical protein
MLFKSRPSRISLEEMKDIAVVLVPTDAIVDATRLSGGDASRFRVDGF